MKEMEEGDIRERWGKEKNKKKEGAVSRKEV